MAYCMPTGTEKAITWMNSTVNGRPVTPRTGYIVEVNSLWYNALRFIADLVREDGNVHLADELDAQAEVTGKSFVEVFRNECGYLFDYVDGFGDGLERPSQYDIYRCLRLFPAGSGTEKAGA